MKFAILTFPGSNCDRDIYNAIKNELGQDAEYVRQSSRDPNALDPFDVIIIPGGSSYGDALRPGCIAATSNIINALYKANQDGKPILGICNGFQILTEAKLLPGVLLKNPSMKYICKTTQIKITTNNSAFTNQYKTGQIVNYPIAHAKGNYYCSQEILQELKDNNQILFTYEGNSNPNGSIANIAGITNKAGNILGMMPHPERAMNMLMGNTHGLGLFKSILHTLQYGRNNK